MIMLDMSGATAKQKQRYFDIIKYVEEEAKKDEEKRQEMIWSMIFEIAESFIAGIGMIGLLGAVALCFACIK